MELVEATAERIGDDLEARLCVDRLADGSAPAMAGSNSSGWGKSSAASKDVNGTTGRLNITVADPLGAISVAPSVGVMLLTFR